MPDYDLGTARGKIEIDASGATRGVGEANAAVDTLEGKAGNASATLGKAGLALGGVGIAAVAGFGLAVNAAAGFEKGLSAIEAVSGASEQQMEGIRKKALQLGADTKFSAAEAASAMEELVKAGLPLEAVMSGAADATVALAAAGEVELKEAATIASNAMNQFGLTAKEMPKVADLIAGAANASAIDVSDFGMALSQSGAVANLVGLSFDDLSVAIAAMGNAGIKGSDAGTSLKTMLSNLQPTTEKQIGMMQKLGLMTEDGANAFFHANGEIKSMSEIAGLLNNSTKNLTDQQKTLALETIFGSDAIRAAAVIADSGAEGFDKLAGAMGKVSAEDVAEKRMDNFSGAMEQLKGSIETVAIQIGSILLPALRSFADFITGLVNRFGELSPWMQKVIVFGGLLVTSLVLMAAATLLAVSGFMKARKSVQEFKAAMQALELANKRAMIAEKTRQAVTKVGTGIQAAFNAVMMANPVILVVAALVALGVALFVLYKKFKPFRDLVDGIWQWIQKAFDVVMDVIGGFIDWLKRNWDLLLPIFLGPIGLIIVIVRRFGDDIVRFIGTAINAVVDFFKKLPGRVLGFVSAFVEAVVEFFMKLPERVLFALGFLIGVILRVGIELVKLAFKIGKEIFDTLVDFFIKLPGRVLGLLNLVWDTLWEWGVRFLNTAKEIGTNAVEGFIGFIVALPGRVLGLLNTVWDKLWEFGVRFISEAKRIGTEVFNGIVDFFVKLPGRAWDLLVQLGNKITGFASTAFNKAKEVGQKIWDGINDVVKGIPGLITDIFDKVMTELKNLPGRVFDAAKNIGGKIWGGIKSGLGIGSPSLPERAVTAMTTNIAKDINTLKKHVGTIQGLAADLPSAEANMAVTVGAGVLQPAAPSPSGVVQAPPNTAAPVIGELNINNPVGEPSEESLTRTMQKLEYAGYFGG